MEKQTVFFGIRVTPELSKRIKAHARAKGIKPTTFARLAIEAALQNEGAIEYTKQIRERIKTLDKRIKEAEKMIANLTTVRNEAIRFLELEK